MIDRVDPETGKLCYLANANHGWLKADERTAFRIPGVSRKQSTLDRLESG